MKHQKDAEDIATILGEAPTARKALLDNYTNLSQVAEYCEKNYLESKDDPSKALEQTKVFTTQSLASVVYQISTLATNVLKLLEAQSSQLCHIESSVHLLGLTVDMHREKVARREIGVFTTTKRYSRSNKVIPPSVGKEAKPKYTRTPISYTSLDSLGHGMKDAKPQERKASMIRKQSGTLGRSSRPAEPVQCPVAPSLSRNESQTSLSDKQTTSSFGKAVSPPVVHGWPTSPDTDIVSTLLEEVPLAPPLKEEAGPGLKLITPPTPPPPPFDLCDLLPPPPMPPAEETFDPSDLGSMIPPPPAPPLETVPEENSLPLAGLPSAPLPPPMPDEMELPAPPPLCGDERGDARRSRRPRARQHPPSTRSLSLRVRTGPSARTLYTRSLFLPPPQSLMIPPPPPYPPPLAPPTSLSPLSRIPARLQHLDLEIPAPPPPPEDCMDVFEDMPPLPPPVDYDTSAPTDYLEKVVALYTYNSGKEGDLTFEEGDVIYLTQRNDNGWCVGVLNGLEGFFPGNYVEPTS